MKNQTDVHAFVEQLYRKESGKLIAVLTKLFGNTNIELAEDVVQDSMMEAINNWSEKSIPNNPTGWLYTVAKNKAINILQREQFREKTSSDVAHFFQSKWTFEPAIEFLFSEKEIKDDQLRMIFACCHPYLSHDSQIALALKILCGFKVSEIARAFHTTEENIKKRLSRAKRKIREEKISFDVPVGKELEPRLKGVLETIYLLFNEGYHASSGSQLIKYEIVKEAIGLTKMLAHHQLITSKHLIYALLALMQLNASRFDARLDKDGHIITLEHQDRLRWKKDKIKQGLRNLQRSKPHQYISKYHCLAIISAFHCSARNFKETNWKGILHEYDRLMHVNKSPMIELNRSIALSKVHGPEKAIKTLGQINGLNHYHLYYAAKADIYIQLNQYQDAINSLKKATKLALLDNEKLLLKERIIFCEKKSDKSVPV